MVNTNIRTRVELKNETVHGSGLTGSAGRVALIGAFPSGKQNVYACENFSKLCNHYGVKLNSTAVNWYSGVRAARRLFMEGIRGYKGASSLTCVNICKLKPNYFENVSSLYTDSYPETEEIYDNAGSGETGTIAINASGNKYIPDDTTLKQDVSLTFDKLKNALTSIADEDMDLLFIANDLWEIFDTPLREREAYPALKKGAVTEDKRRANNWEVHAIVTDENGVPVTVKEPVVDSNGNPVLNNAGEQTYIEHLKNPYITRINSDGVEEYVLTPKLEVKNENDFYSNTSRPRQSQVINSAGKLQYEKDKSDSTILQPITKASAATEKKEATTYTGLASNSTTSEEIRYVYFNKENLNWTKTPHFYNRPDVINKIIRDTSKKMQPVSSFIKPLPKNRPVLLISDVKVDNVTYTGMRPWYVDSIYGSTVKATGTGVNTTYSTIPYLKSFKIVVDKNYRPVTVEKDGVQVLKCPFLTKVDNGETVYDTDSSGKTVDLPDYVADGTQKLESDETIVYAYFINDGTTNSSPSWYDDHLDKLFYDPFCGTLKTHGEMTDSLGRTIYGITDKGKYIRNIGDVYNYILDFVDNEFTNHRPVNYIGAIKTRDGAEGIENGYSMQGKGSEIIRVESERFDYENVNDETKRKLYTPTDTNPYADIVKWGAVDIAKLFARTTNELTTCGLFYQGGIIGNGSSDGEEVDSMELAAHITGWLCGLPLEQDLTYQTIPGLLAIDEEPYLGEYDAGYALNSAGIQVIKPKNRLEKTFYVNNSIMPSGWHTNHVRSVTYLLRRLQFETGLGINNYLSNTEAYRVMLDTVAREVQNECNIIRGVDVGDVEVISHDHIYVPISIVLSGVITLINIGVGMALDETGTWGTYVRTNSGTYVKSSAGYSYSA